MKVLIVVGTRPEGIKMAPVIRYLQIYYPEIETLVCSTGQHGEMLDQVFSLFEISPDFDLNLMKHDQTPAEVAARVLLALDPILAKHSPDWLLVQGDTTTVAAAALAAHYRGVKVGHIEAGLRSYDRANPFPEEMNRVVADHVADKHFAPTAKAKACLLAERIPPDSIHVTGNTVTDALLWAVSQSSDATNLPWPEDLKDFLGSDNGHIVLVTAHRRENHGEPIRRICRALSTIAQERPQTHFVYPVHRNPNIWNPVHQLLASRPNIHLLPPVDYLLLANLMRYSRVILTDSGGIQEEAPTLGIPVLVMRETTERPEAIEAGVARLVGTSEERIVNETLRLLDDDAEHAKMSRAINPYGDGKAASRIVESIVNGSCEDFEPGA